jgi:hypothetical protein
MNRSAFFMVLLLALFAACDFGQSDDEVVTLPSPVRFVRVTNDSALTLTLVAKASWHNGCGHFGRAEVTRNGLVYSIKVFGSQKKNAVCTQAFIEYDAPVSFMLEAGTYTFKFWRSDTSSVDTTLTL